MEWLNYHHLLYFWAVARHGSVVRASAELKLAQPTISGQVRRLEEVLGVKLFDRVGRTLVLTEVGRTVFRYADEIFSIGQDLVSTLKGRPSLKPLRLTVGVADVLPKVLVQKLLEPAFHIDKPIQLVCREDRVVEDFLGALATNEVERRYKVDVVGWVKAVRQQFYAISVDRRVQHPVLPIVNAARQNTFR